MLALVSFAGYLIKPSTIIALIAVFIILAMEFIYTHNKGKWRVGSCVICFICGIVMGIVIKYSISESLGYVQEKNRGAALSTYFITGTTKETSGAYIGDAFELISRYGNEHTLSERKHAEIAKALNNLGSMGFFGAVEFFTQKMVMTMNDGTFCWYNEGIFVAYNYPEISGSSLKWVLRNIYWDDGSAYRKFNTLSQLLWIFVQLGVFLCFLTEMTRLLRVKRGDNAVKYMLMIAILGLYMYILLFEARARYILVFLPVFATAGAVGTTELFIDIDRFITEHIKLKVHEQGKLSKKA